MAEMLVRSSESITLSFISNRPMASNALMNSTHPNSCHHHYENVDDDLFFSEQYNVLLVFFCVMALILLLGLVCNFLAIIVCMTSGNIRRSTTGHFLIAISVADLLYLCGDLFRCLNVNVMGRYYFLGVDLVDRHNFSCKLLYYLRYVGMFSCSWLTVAITVERFITVSLPLHVSRISTPFKVKLIITSVFLIAFTLGSFPIWTVGIDYDPTLCRDICAVIDSSYYTWWVVYVRYLSLFLASAIIFLLIGLILFFLHRARARRRRHMEGQAMLASESKGQGRSIERQLTAMFLGMGLAFLFLRLPYIVMYEIYSNREIIWDEPGPSITKPIYILLKASDLLLVSNYAANFFLYCLCGSIFRRQTVQLFRNLSRRRTVSTSLHGASIPLEDIR